MRRGRARFGPAWAERRREVELKQSRRRRYWWTYPQRRRIQSGPWKGWIELGYTEEGVATHAWGVDTAPQRPLDGPVSVSSVAGTHPAAAVAAATAGWQQAAQRAGFNLTRWQEILVEQLEEARLRGRRVQIDFPRPYGRVTVGSMIEKALRDDLRCAPWVVGEGEEDPR